METGSSETELNGEVCAVQSDPSLVQPCAHVNRGFDGDEEDNKSSISSETEPPSYYKIALESQSRSSIRSLKGKEKNTPVLLSVSQNNNQIVSDTKGITDVSEEGTIFGLTKSKFLLLFSLCLADFLSLTCSSLHAPFYPRVAVQKGASLVAAGFVFGIFQLTVFITCLFYGSLFKRIGPKRMAITGIMAMAVSSIAFGFLDHIEGATAFITLSFIVRIIQANGNAAFVTASFAIIANEFPTSVAKAISYMETASGLGLIVGPAVGGGLFELGGFITPFAVMGVLLFLSGILSHVWTPERQISSDSNEIGDEKPRGMLSLLGIPTVFLAAFSILAGASAIGYLLPTLEPHVHKHFELPQSFTGIIFVIDGAMYALFNPMWGYLCDKFNQPRVISLIGSVLIFFGFAVIGPATFLPWSPILWVTCIGCGFFGLGVGATFVSGFVQALTDAKSRGFPDNVGTYGLVSGMWFSMMSLGCFVGASAGGALADYFGFENGVYLILSLQVLVALWTILFMLMCRRRSSSETNLSNSSSSSQNEIPIA